MEEAKLVQSATTQIPNPPSSVEAPPSLPPKTKKRPLDSDAHISNSTYFQIRAVLREIRPHVLEAIRTKVSIISGKQQPEDGEIKGAYVVGGSAFGWNFITFSGMEPVYYGMTKESFRAQAAKLTTV
ncbi:hypothetical protein M0R45_035759 [Rubus argutus]|uniref:Uncharacterized protein n=1 Tax=Rubus argutus TaxID=59490 RepID=A0AAW1VXV0_RUBAR